MLHRNQMQAWGDLHRFAGKFFSGAPAFATGASEGMMIARKRKHKPASGLPHPPALYERDREWTNGLDAWHLVAMHAICAQAKSFLLAVAILEQEHPESPFQDLSKAIDASRVEEEFQISNWGMVEGGHDYDRLNCSVQLRAAQLLIKAIAIDNSFARRK